MATNLVSGSFCQFGFYLGCLTTYDRTINHRDSKHLDHFLSAESPHTSKMGSQKRWSKDHAKPIPVSGSGWKTNKQPTFKPIRPCNMLEDFFPWQSFSEGNHFTPDSGGTSFFEWFVQLCAGSHWSSNIETKRKHHNMQKAQDLFAPINSNCISWFSSESGHPVPSHPKKNLQPLNIPALCSRVLLTQSSPMFKASKPIAPVSISTWHLGIWQAGLLLPAQFFAKYKQ